ncbi:unnamed protein product, partial [Sphenostylis stenocarpa]
PLSRLPRPSSRLVLKRDRRLKIRDHRLVLDKDETSFSLGGSPSRLRTKTISKFQTTVPNSS